MSCLPALAGVCPTQRQVRRDTIILAESTLIVAGADTHADTIHVAADHHDRRSHRRPGVPDHPRRLHRGHQIPDVVGAGGADRGRGHRQLRRRVHPSSHRRRYRGRRGDPRGQVHPTAQGQVRSARCLQCCPHRVGRRRAGHPERRCDLRAASSAHRSPLGGQAPHRGDQPDQGHARVRTGRRA